MHSPGAGATGQAHLALEHVNDFTSGLFVTCIARHQQHFTQATGAFVLTSSLVAADVAVLELHSSLASTVWRSDHFSTQCFRTVC